MSLSERVIAEWDAAWLWNRHSIATRFGCSLQAAGRVIRRLAREGRISPYGRRGPFGVLYQRVG